MPDGSKKKFRRRIIILNVVKKPKDEKSPVEEEPVQYEEVEIDEANPEDDKYDPKVNFVLYLNRIVFCLVLSCPYHLKLHGRIFTF